jgi:hypothetical protein
MKQTLTVSDIAEQLRRDENANWSPAGARAMAEYLDELDNDCGTESEFDRVAVRCDFAEYKSLREWSKEYFGSEWNWGDKLDDEIRDYINDRGTLIEFDGGIIVSSF